MGFLSRVLDNRERRSSFPGWLVEHFGAPTAAGPSVSEESALRFGAVYACVRIIAEDIASLPLITYRQQGRSKERARDHPLYTVLHDLANPETTSFEWREMMISHLLLWGNAYSEIEYSRNGEVLALWPLRPDRMEEIRRNRQGQLEYGYRLPDQTMTWLPWWRVHHIRGLGGDGIRGWSPIRLAARQAVGLGLAAEEFGARFFSNGARPGLLLKAPGKLSEKAFARLQESFAAEHQGLSNAHRTKILEEGLDIVTVGIPPNEAQFLETRKFQVQEIARIFRVPPHLLADLDRATFSNIEHQSLSYVIHTLRPWLVRHEQAIYRDLLFVEERRDYFVRYQVAGLLRGDTATRYAAYTTAINSGFMTRNEARELEDWNPIDGLDEPLVPMNMIEAGSEPPLLVPPARSHEHGEQRMAADVSEPDAWDERAERIRTDRQAIMQRHVRVFADVAERVVKREAADIRKALPRYLGKRDAAGFESWLAQFYEDMREWMPGYYRALMDTYAETIMAAVAAEVGGKPRPLDDDMRAWLEGYLTNFTEVYAVGGEKQIRALLAEAEDEEDAAAAIEERLTGWEENRAQKTALEQAFEAGNALAIVGYVYAGRKFLRWSARGDSCPLCKKLDGRKIPIDGAFVDEGGTVEADGVDPLPVVRKVRHGPLHSGCDCVTISA